MAPARRGWQPAVPAAVVVASLSVCAGVAFAGGGGVTPPDPPKVTDVVCISTCGGIHKATTGSKVQLSGRHLKHVTQVRFNADGGGRIAADPIAVASRSVKVWVPDGAATGKPKVTDSYHSAKSPTELKIVRCVADRALRELQAPEGLREAAQVLLLRQEEAERDLHVHEHRAHRRADRRRQAAAGHGRRQLDRARAGAEHGPHRQMERSPTPAGPLSTAPTSSASAPRAAAWSPPPTPGSNTTASSSRFAAPTATATGSAPRGPATSTRDRTSWPDAAPRWWRPVAAGCSGRPTRRAAPATTW